MKTARSDDDPAARWMGLAVFLLGIACLVVVFVLMYADLAGSGLLGQLASPATPRDATAAWWTLAAKAVFFFLMIYAGSAIAARGIGLYAAARAPHEA
ncbi:MAG: hypothetical protein QN168_11670 [Armatimonadota bacterium]|nr:hypothetical protein [Armatimonadota bacterium]